MSKVDRALAAYLISVGAGTADDVYSAKRSLDKALPHTVCHAQRWTLLSPYTATYLVQAQVLVKTNAAVDVDESESDVKDPSEERVGATFDAFFFADENASAGNDLADAITAAARASGDADLSEFTVQNVEVKGGDAGQDRHGPAWMDAIDLELVVCPKNVD